MYSLFLILASVLVLSAHSRALDQCLKLPFHGITETNPNGDATGRADKGDWGCLDASGNPVGLLAPNDVPVPPPLNLCFYPAKPNPAPSGVRLNFSLPSASSVRLTIYGESKGHGKPEAVVVRHLVVDSQMAPGLFEVSWGLNDDNGARVEPGIYRAVLEVGDHVLCGDIEVQ